MVYKFLFEKVLKSIGEVQADRKHLNHDFINSHIFHLMKTTKKSELHVKLYLSETIIDYFLNISDAWRESSFEFRRKILAKLKVL